MFRQIVLGLCFVTAAVRAEPQPLEVEVLRTGAGSLFANYALIKGEKKAVLVDAPWTRADAHRLVAMILDSGKELETVFITHDHPDHFFSMEVITEAFPNVRVVAHPTVVADIWRSLPSKVKRWYPIMGANAPRRPTAPMMVEGDRIDLESRELRIIGPFQGDHARSTVLWAPSIGALFPGDLVFDEVFPWLGEHDAKAIEAWGRSLEQLAELKPTMIVPGHSKPELPFGTSGLDYTRRYIVEWPKFVAAARNSGELAAKVRKEFPDSVDVLGDFLLGTSARVAMARNQHGRNSRGGGRARRYFVTRPVAITMTAMNRRRFVQAGMSSLLVPAAIVASPLEGLRAGTPSGAPAWDYVFVDDRFPPARQLASEICGSTVPTPVLGDVTDLWTGGLATASLAAPMALAGITTESFFFCLKTLLADRVRVDAMTTRHDRDLHLWTIRTDNHSKNGTMSWQNLSRLA